MHYRHEEPLPTYLQHGQVHQLRKEPHEQEEENRLNIVDIYQGLCF